MRSMQRPYLVDEAAAALQLALEIHLGDESVMFRISAILGAIARCRVELRPVLEIVAREQHHAEIRTVHRDVGAAIVVAHRGRHRPAAKDEFFIPSVAIPACQDRGTLRRSHDQRNAHRTLPSGGTRTLEQDFLKLKHPYFVIARLVQATHFFPTENWVARTKHKAGDHEWRGNTRLNDTALSRIAAPVAASPHPRVRLPVPGPVRLNTGKIVHRSSVSTPG
jgi:hypothetical protein